MTRCHTYTKQNWCRIVEKINEKVIFVFWGLQYSSRKPNHAKIINKPLSGLLLGHLPKMHYSLVQCTVWKNPKFLKSFSQILIV